MNKQTGTTRVSNSTFRQHNDVALPDMLTKSLEQTKTQNK